VSVPELSQVTVEDADWGALVFDVRLAGPENGPLVLLLHGFPQTSWSWRNQIEPLAAAGYRVAAPDQRGYSPGARPESVEAYARDTMMNDPLALATMLGHDRFHLVGHDWGGSLAWQLAGRRGERLLTLTSLTTPHPQAMADAYAGKLGGDQASRSMYVDMFRAEGSEDGMLANEAAGLRLILQGGGLSEAESQPYAEALGTSDALRAALNWYRAMSLADVDGLGPITTPTLYMWGTNDVALGPEPARATADHVTGPYTVVELEGADHWVPEHSADAVTAALLEHLATATP
jgi:pimeloyl-ACP methyl ester carboxylesterase